MEETESRILSGLRDLASSRRRELLEKLPTHHFYNPVKSEERLLDHSNDGQLPRYSSELSEYSPPSFASYSPPTSRSSSGSHEPMLKDKPQPPRRSRAGVRKVSDSIIRYICLAIIAGIAIVLIYLIRLSQNSSRMLELHIYDKGPGGGTGRQIWEARKYKGKPMWLAFEKLEGFYRGIRTLKTANEGKKPPSGKIGSNSSDYTFPESIPFIPYPDYTSSAYLKDYYPVNDCFLDHNDTVRAPFLRAYPGVSEGHLDPYFGSYSIFGQRDDLCFERFGRLGPYGYGYLAKRGGTDLGLDGDREGIQNIWGEDGPVDWRGIKWRDVQDRCNAQNSRRFSNQETARSESFKTMSPWNRRRDSFDDPPPVHVEAKKLLPRTAIVLRTWSDYNYRPMDIVNLRALVSELSLLSGGEYTIHFLIHVKDDNSQIWAKEDVYERVLRESLPEEFWGMGTLWTERQMGLIYGGLHETFYRDLPVHGVYRSALMPLQYFAQLHPEFDFFWNWEMDIRYTGHFYELFNTLSKWAREQPRKGIWERSGRFYIPAVHGNWEDFKSMTRVQEEIGVKPLNIWNGLVPNTTSEEPIEPSVWGPVSFPGSDDLDHEQDPSPPTPYEKDDYEWGVGEEADLITLNPMFDPAGTSWLLGEDMTGYNADKPPPRRATINTSARLSRRLLNVMHDETALMRHSMFVEMWPATVALHHGLKAIFAPHPVYLDRKWPVQVVSQVFNAGKNGASGGAWRSVFGSEEHNFEGATWFYNARFAGKLWRRWLGHRVDSEGGEEVEMKGEGRMCLRPMLLHPVKDERAPVDPEFGD